MCPGVLVSGGPGVPWALGPQEGHRVALVLKVNGFHGLKDMDYDVYFTTPLCDNYRFAFRDATHQARDP